MRKEEEGRTQGRKEEHKEGRKEGRKEGWKEMMMRGDVFKFLLYFIEVSS